MVGCTHHLSLIVTTSASTSVNRFAQLYCAHTPLLHRKLIHRFSTREPSELLNLLRQTIACPPAMADRERKLGNEEFAKG